MYHNNAVLQSTNNNRTRTAMTTSLLIKRCVPVFATWECGCKGRATIFVLAILFTFINYKKRPATKKK